MPEPNGPPYQIAGDLGGWPIWTLIDQRVTVKLECAACHHQAEWSPEYMQRRFPKLRGKPLWWLAPKLRCFRCRSHYVRLWKA